MTYIDLQSEPFAASPRRSSASLACRGTVKVHLLHVHGGCISSMSMGEMQKLITELFQAEQPYACPHGRPVVLRIGDAELERRFGCR